MYSQPAPYFFTWRSTMILADCLKAFAAVLSVASMLTLYYRSVPRVKSR